MGIRILREAGMDYFVYILTNRTNVVLYTGVTNDLERRLWKHRSHADPNSCQVSGPQAGLF